MITYYVITVCMLLDPAPKYTAYNWLLVSRFAIVNKQIYIVTNCERDFEHVMGSNMAPFYYRLAVAREFVRVKFGYIANPP